MKRLKTAFSRGKYDLESCGLLASQPRQVLMRQTRVEGFLSDMTQSDVFSNWVTNAQWQLLKNLCSVRYQKWEDRRTRYHSSRYAHQRRNAKAHHRSTYHNGRPQNVGQTRCQATSMIRRPRTTSIKHCRSSSQCGQELMMSNGLIISAWAVRNPSCGKATTPDPE